MSRVAYVNGRYVPHREAAVHVEDRGYQFADGVYEVAAVMDGRLLDLEPHLDRLDRSLDELRIAHPLARPALRVVLEEVRRRNRLHNGLLYFQVTRGVARRDHPFPRQAEPALVVTAKPLSFASMERQAEAGVGVISVPDQRWARCDIKSVGLLPNILAKQAAREAGAYEAWMIDREGFVTEGSSTNAWIVDRDGRVITRDISNAILSGITRKALLAAARREGIEIVERKFTIEEAKAAREAFITSATAFVTPVTSIDGQTLGNGHPGELATRLRRIYLDAARAEVAQAA
ncbi:D-amino-acid transaminase [Zavarzinia sp. CC-PAN008]|uniref:D-amino-acid transaminase n=1 Tax=Zavarzinia sp. CC-PAN008 TaxID=3243332 RepID=UPI003F74A740